MKSRGGGGGGTEGGGEGEITRTLKRKSYTYNIIM